MIISSQRLENLTLSAFTQKILVVASLMLRKPAGCPKTSNECGSEIPGMHSHLTPTYHTKWTPKEGKRLVSSEGFSLGDTGAEPHVMVFSTLASVHEVL